MRQIFLDTETTGIRIEDGHKVIEIGCLEMINRKLTGKHFHVYINPRREVEAGALAIHGITNEFLKDKPIFADVANDLIQFIDGAELIIHNAPFDVGFLNYEIQLIGLGLKSLNDYCRIIDTLQMARQMHPGQRNSLDALCKRYHVDNSKRDWHGALLDASLLAQVYLAMTGGQGNFFETLTKSTEVKKTVQLTENAPLIPSGLLVLTANTEELAQHENYLKLLQKQGKCLWLKE